VHNAIFLSIWLVLVGLGLALGFLWMKNSGSVEILSSTASCLYFH